MRLVPCAACARHIRYEDSSCRFCGQERTPEAAPAPRALPRTGRAAIVAIGLMTGASGAAGCECEPATPGMDAGPEAPDAPIIGAFDAAYGGPPIDVGPELDAGTDAGELVPPYDAPPVDAGGAGEEADAGPPEP